MNKRLEWTASVQLSPLFTLREQPYFLNNFEMAPAALPRTEQHLLDQALDALGRTTGLQGRVLARDPELPKGRRPDALIEIAADNRKYKFLVEAKRIDRFGALGAIKTQLNLYRDKAVLVAPYITAETAERCRELNIHFIDTAGNAYLRAPGLYVLTTGHRKPAPEILNPPTRAGTVTALRVTFVLLCKPELLNAPYREIADAANVALGAVGWVFSDLNARGLITGTRRGDRRFLEPKPLLQEWATNYPIKLRPKLNPRRFRALDNEWWKRVDLVAYGAMWGGEVAADKLTAYLKPAKFTIYLRPKQGKQTFTQLIAANRFRADPRGDIEILNAFWHLPANPAQPDVVPPVLVYADLMATLDPRNFEVAQMIYERYIDYALRQP